MDPTPSNSVGPTPETPPVTETPETTASPVFETQNTEASSDPAFSASTPEPAPAVTESPVNTPQATQIPEAPVANPVAAPFAPASVPVAATVENPGYGLGVASFILSLVGFNIVGLILGLIALNQSKKAGHKNGFALAGVIIGAISFVLLVLYIILSVVLVLASN